MKKVRYLRSRSNVGCKTCDTDEFTEYSEKYDSYYCTSCKEWTESTCNCKDGECPFPKRPIKPPIEN